jgi:hypothetical protein
MSPALEQLIGEDDKIGCGYAELHRWVVRECHYPRVPAFGPDGIRDPVESRTFVRPCPLEYTLMARMTVMIN